MQHAEPVTLCQFIGNVGEGGAAGFGHSVIKYKGRSSGLYLSNRSYPAFLQQNNTKYTMISETNAFSSR